MVVFNYNIKKYSNKIDDDIIKFFFLTHDKIFNTDRVNVNH